MEGLNTEVYMKARGLPSQIPGWAFMIPGSLLLKIVAVRYLILQPVENTDRHRGNARRTCESTQHVLHMRKHKTHLLDQGGQLHLLSALDSRPLLLEALVGGKAAQLLQLLKVVHPRRDTHET